jgi:vitamin B12 transporter
MLIRLQFPILIFLFLLFATTPSYAQTAPIKIQETVVVTATGRETPGSKVGATVTVLDSDQIEQRRALSTVDLLRMVPSVIASRPGGVGNLTSLWVRGGESTYNKVLLDGMPLNEPGGFFNFASLSPENIERIEVLRGAHSALFGSDAMASVIQIFSTRPAAGRRQFDLTVDGGTYSTGHVAAGFGGTDRRLDYRVFGSRLVTDNREPNNEHDATTWSGLLGSRYQSGTAMRFVGRGDFGRTGVPGQTAFRRPDMDAFFDHHDADFLAGWDQPVGRHIVQRTSYSVARTQQTSTNLILDPPSIARFGDRVAARPSSDFLYDSETRYRRHHFDYRADAALGSGQTLTAAFAYDGERGTLTNRMSLDPPQRPARNNTGTTIQYESILGPVSTLAGIRFENNGSFGFYTAPRASFSWRMRAGEHEMDATRLRASAGLGIKEPTFLQSYSLSPFFRGNPDLEPERSRGFDVGLEQRVAGDRARVEATYFANHFDDLISLGPSNPVTFESQYSNIGETRASGLELAADAVVRGGLQIRGHYTLLDSKVIRSTSSSPIFQPGRALFRRPRHSGSVQGTFTHARIGITLGAVFVGQRVDTDSASLGMESNASYAAVNATGHVRLARRTSAFITIDNLGDADYMDPLGYRALGRTIRAGIRTRF